MALAVNNPPANAGELRDVVSISGPGRSLEEGMAIHFSILAWRIPWTEEPGRRSLAGSRTYGCKESDIIDATEHAHACILNT